MSLEIYLIVSALMALGGCIDFCLKIKQFQFWLTLMWFAIFFIVWPYGFFKVVKRWFRK
jgi:hypothetical protein